MAHTRGLSPERGRAVRLCVVQVLRINPERKDITAFCMEDFELLGYAPHKKIEMKMAV